MIVPTDIHRQSILSRSRGGIQLSRAAAGFTVIEIVTVIIILAILSSVAMSRILSGNALNAIVVRDQIISLARTAQQNALGRSDVDLVITPSASGDEITLTTNDNAGVIESYTFSLSTVELSGDINNTDSCAATSGADAISNAAPLTLTFGELGDLGVSGVTGSTGAVTSAVRIRLNDTASESVCVSPSGFSYAGDCDV
ncbi:MAG: prepilin-type N-terminal cleavage/methylation domain-containing protein [Flavobacteriales bacterium]|nr:prepilin-type N-terminal cleavage/methylation domain-containing protein [Flavobacteriales bacterium]